MTKWLVRRDKVEAFDSYLKTTHSHSQATINIAGNSIHLPKYPHHSHQKISDIEEKHGCINSFTRDLKEYFSKLQDPTRQHHTIQHLQRINLPFSHLDVYHSFKLFPSKLHEDKVEKDVIEATPVRKGASHARFDPVVVIDDTSNKEAETTGLTGLYSYFCIKFN